MVSLYEKITYDEEERKIKPHLYKTNRLCEHKTIIGKDNVLAILNRFQLPLGLLDEQISFSILWNLPRMEYNETKMWVSLSGETHNGYAPFKHFVISDNASSEEYQIKAKQLIEYLNKSR